MKATLNLRFDKDTIEAAKAYAGKQHLSLSQIVESYLKELVSRDRKKKFVSDRLIGVLGQYKDLSDDELMELYLKEKHHA